MPANTPTCNSRKIKQQTWPICEKADTRVSEPPSPFERQDSNGSRSTGMGGSRGGSSGDANTSKNSSSMSGNSSGNSSGANKNGSYAGSAFGSMSSGGRSRESNSGNNSGGNTNDDSGTGSGGDDQNSGNNDSGSGGDLQTSVRAPQVSPLLENHAKSKVMTKHVGETRQPNPKKGSHAKDAKGKNTQHPTLNSSGPCKTVGSAGHECGECRPCAFYCYSRSGCFKGDQCSYCHLQHESKLRIRRDTWLKTHKPWYSDRDGSESTHSECHSSSLDAETPYVAGPEQIPCDMPARKQHLGGVVSKVLEPAYTSDQLFSGPMPQLVTPGIIASVPAPCPTISEHEVQYSPMVGPPGMEYDSMLQGGPNGAANAAFANSLVDLQARLANSVAGVLTGAPALPAFVHGNIQAPTNASSGGMPSGFPATSPTCMQNAGAAPRCTANESLSYSPATVVAAIGQKLELCPVANDGLRTRAYAVVPGLPRGMIIDKHSGLIHGTPQEATDGVGTHFVSSCDPSSPYPVVNMAIVNIQIVNLAAPPAQGLGYNLMQHTGGARAPPVPEVAQAPQSQHDQLSYQYIQSLHEQAQQSRTSQSALEGEVARLKQTIANLDVAGRNKGMH